MGDIVHALPAIRALAEARPDFELQVLTQRAFVPLFAGLDHVAAVIAHDRRPAMRGMVRTIRRLSKVRFAAALDFQGNAKSALLTRLSRAPIRVGMARFARTEPASAKLLNHLVAEASDGLHPASLGFDVASAAARLVPSSSESSADAASVTLDRAWLERPTLRASAAERALEATALRALGVDPTRPFFVVVVGVPGDPRTWPVEQVSAWHETLQLSGAAQAVALFGPAEADEQGPAGIPQLRHASGELRRLVALGALVRDAGGVVVGPDQGAVHVLAAAGAETRVLFGPQDPALTAPVRATVERSTTPPDCMPCRSRRCTHAKGPICMEFMPRSIR